MQSTVLTGFPGGIYHATNIQPRDFQLTCFFEQLTEAEIERIYQWVEYDSSGDLIFDNKPWVKYFVRPTKIATGQIYPAQQAWDGQTVYGGQIEITLTAYNAWGEMTYNSFDTYDSDNAGGFCGIVKTSEMPTITNR